MDQISAREEVALARMQWKAREHAWALVSPKANVILLVPLVLL